MGVGTAAVIAKADVVAVAVERGKGKGLEG